MGTGRIVSGCLATLAVAGCAVLAVGMASAGADRGNSAAAGAPHVGSSGSAPWTSIPAQLPVVSTKRARVPADSRTAAGPSATARAATSVPPSRPAPTPSARPTSSAAPHVTAEPTTSRSTVAPPPALRAPTSHLASTASAAVVARPTTAPHTVHPVVKRGVSLPLRYATATAKRVITVVAHSTHSTTATLQAWNKAAGGGWLKSGRAVTAHVGADGLSRSPSESRSATPIGSFTLTQAFGRDSNPGTHLPYFKTTPADWWISQPGRLYNTHQRCSSRCSFTQGNPNEHLYYETPFYDYAVVIDYNTRNAGPVRQGAGSAFFLHVTDGQPTAGCVSIPQSRLVPIMRWLVPSTHPRILIGVS